MKRSVLAVLVFTVVLAASATAQAPQADHQIAAAVAPAPPELQADATVLGFDADGALVTLRKGTNHLVCLADEPGDDRFHVACYHQALEPFMARGRALRAEGKERDDIAAIREQEIAEGKLAMPEQPTLLYQLFGTPESFDAATGTVQNTRRLTVIYMPYATAESTGLPTSAPAGAPWIMNPGKPWAHIMLLEAEKQ